MSQLLRKLALLDTLCCLSQIKVEEDLHIFNTHPIINDVTIHEKIGKK